MLVLYRDRGLEDDDTTLSSIWELSLTCNEDVLLYISIILLP